MASMAQDHPRDLLEELAAGHGRIEPITVEQYHHMLETGILEEGAPIELLDGLLVHKDRGSARYPDMTVGPPHSAAVDRLAMLQEAVRDAGCYVRIQQPLTCAPNHEPEPDAAIVRGTPRDYTARHPAPADVTCVIEVADSSLIRDRRTKQRIYARAAIAQYVIVNLVDDVIEVYVDPDTEAGTYRSRTEVRSPHAVVLQLGGDAQLTVPAADWLA